MKPTVAGAEPMMHRHVNPDGSLGGLTDQDLPPTAWLMHEDLVEQLLATVDPTGGSSNKFNISAEYMRICKQLNEPMTESEYDRFTKFRNDINDRVSVDAFESYLQCNMSEFAENVRRQIDQECCDALFSTTSSAPNANFSFWTPTAVHDMQLD